MNCIEVRDRLAEFTLGVLSQEEAAAVERHLDWCAGCRKEAEELREGSAAFGLGLAPAAPPAALQERVVEHLIGPRPGTKEGVQSATRHALHHRRIRRLAFTTLAAALIAVLSVGWAVSVRYDARRAEQDAANRVNAVQVFNSRLVSLVRQLDLNGHPFLAQLNSVAPGNGSGSAVLITTDAPNTQDFLGVDVILLPGYRGPVTVRLQLHGGRFVPAGSLAETKNGDLALYEYTPLKLDKVQAVQLVDVTGSPVMTGIVQPFSRH